MTATIDTRGSIKKALFSILKDDEILQNIIDNFLLAKDKGTLFEQLLENITVTQGGNLFTKEELDKVATVLMETAEEYSTMNSSAESIRLTIARRMFHGSMNGAILNLKMGYIAEKLHEQGIANSIEEEELIHKIVRSHFYKKFKSWL